MSFATTISDLDFINRMLDYAHGVHSIPESSAAADEQEDTFGPQWDRPSCDCKLYAYEHGGCLGPAAKCLPRGWKSGDDV